MNRPDQNRTNHFFQKNNLTTVQAIIVCNILTGYTEEQIADRLKVSRFYVRVNVKRIQRKLERGAAC